MKNKFLYFSLVILMLSALLVGCSRTSNKTINIKVQSESIFINSTMNVGVEMSDGSFPSDKVTFTSADDSIIKIDEQLSNYSIRLKATGVGTTKLKAEFKEHMKEIDITVKPNYNTVGNGTEESPFQLSEIEHLKQLFANSDENENKHFKLMNNIIIEEEWYAPSLTGEAYSGHTFKGHFDGNGKTVEFLQGRGFLFGDNEGTIRNLKIKGQGVVAFIADTNHGEISNCIIEGTINISNMFNQFGSITNYNTGSIKNCISKIDIIADEQTYMIGGICGVIESGIIESCLFLGSITVNSAYNNGDSVGAILGHRYSEDAVLKNLYYDANTISSSNIKTSYIYPDSAVGFHGVEIPISETENVTNVVGISDWQTADFSELDSVFWDFNQDIPRLKLFL